VSDRVELTGTYRLQLQPGFGFDDVAQLAPYLTDLGVSHVYLSPVLQAAPGSTHGYDVVDHATLNVEHGGAEGFDRMVRALRSAGLGVVVDVVPNHMAVPTPESGNQVLWSVLKDGPGSAYAAWFDVDWSAHQPVLIPVLGQRIGAVLAAGEVTLDRSGKEPVLRYHEHVWPVRPGTQDLPLEDLVDAQHYRLAYWRVGDEELNYRRFFDVDTLAAIRVEDPAVFAESHALLIALIDEGKVDGLRIDHPDGLADPRGYLRRLDAATASSWVVVEKILEGEEVLPEDWPCAGTTGYDALRQVDGVLIDPEGLGRLVELHAELGEGLSDLDAIVRDAKREVTKRSLQAEVQRLVEVVEAIGAEDIRLRDHSKRSLARALIELLVAVPVYRAYVVPGEPPPATAVATIEQAAASATKDAPDVADELETLRGLALGRYGRSVRKDEFVVRFQQTCGPVMAKGVEDTAFYRWYPLVSLCEVGGDPTAHGTGVEAFHAWAVRQQEQWPLAMTTLSTHDTKRSEDLRLRLAVLTELPQAAAAAFTEFRWAAERHAGRGASGEAVPSAQVEYLVWQNLVGAWPISLERMSGYLQKALREAKQQTSWQVIDEAYETVVQGWLAAVLADPDVVGAIDALVARLAPYARTNTLSAKLVQLTMPGVPDVYQGCEAVDRSLVDPDNRRPVDFAARRVWAGLAAAGAGTDAEKVLVVRSALRLRRERPSTFGMGAAGTHTPLPGVGPAAGHALAFGRGHDVITVVTRLPAGLEAAGGWGDTSLTLPTGAWVDRLGGSTYAGDVRLADLLEALPVALLVRSGSATGP
jgi:(1->4)-alpha-D-glucan 1-alpha-D-glucosylmutase